MKIKLFHNCLIYTVDQYDSIADAICIFRDKIISVGTEKKVRRDLKNFLEQSEKDNKIELKEINLNGLCIVPGFIDAHMHPIITLYYKTQIKLSEVKSYKELERILKREDTSRDEGEWLLGFDLMEDRFTDKDEQYFPDRFKLDSLCSNRPVIIFRYDGHICSVNSKALEYININKTNVQEFMTPSGEIRVDAEGSPTGVFTEEATSFVLEKAPMPSNERLKEISKRFSDELASYGITTCGVIIQAGELGIAGKAGRMELPFLKYLIKENLIEQDYVIFLVTNRFKKLNQVNRSLLKILDKNDKIIVGGLKLWGDGGFGAFTAYMFEPFSDSLEGKTGFMITKKDELLKIFRETYDSGFNLACHAVGDKANRIVVDVYKELLDETQKERGNIRCRIEHASLINNETLKDAADLGIVIVSQPMFINSEYEWLEKRLGPKRIKNTYPFRSIIDYGIILAGASDAPIESPDVLKAIQISITRKGFVPEQAITAYEGLKMFTWNAAYALGQEKIKGSLEKGKLADFVILEKDIITLPSEEIANIKILETYHRGRKIYSSD